MIYATLKMRKPEDCPKDTRQILMLFKGETDFKVGQFYHHFTVDPQTKEPVNRYAIYGFFIDNEQIEMWCDIPTRETINAK